MIDAVMRFLQALVQPVTWTLIHSLWQAALIGLVLAVVLSLVRRRSARLRYALSCLALLLVVGSTTITGVYLSLNAEQTLLIPSNAAAEATEITPSSPSPSPADVEGDDEATLPLFHRLASMTDIGPAVPWVFRIWLIGVLLLSTYRLSGWRHLNRLTTTAAQPVEPSWQAMLSSLSSRFGISQHVELLRSTMIQVPCVIGWVKPIILVPVGFFTGLTAEQVELILAHELAHIRRHDVMINYLQTAVETLLFFNPAAWLISRHIRVEREHCCDSFAVRHCGDPVQYARALVDLETRRSAPAPAAAASGGNLARRVRRLLDPSTDRHRPGTRMVSAAALLIVMTLLLGTVASMSPEPVSAATEVLTAKDFEPSDNDYRGRWRLQQDDDRVWVQLRFKSYGSSTTMRLSLDEIALIPLNSEDAFVLKRDAGSFYCEGGVTLDRDEYEGSGRCYFRPDPAYVDRLREYGTRVRDEDDLFALAVHDISLDFVRGLAELGYDGLSMERLVELNIHDVSPDYIRRLKELGYEGLRTQRLVEMRIHGVDPEYIEELNKAGLTNLNPKRLVEMRIHDVDPEFVADLASLGYADISESRLVEMRIHGVNTDDVRELVELGYKDLDPSDLVAFRIHHVTPRFVRDLAELGYDDVDPDDLVAMCIHNVTASYIRRLQNRGYKKLSPERIIEYRIHGLD